MSAAAVIPQSDQLSKRAWGALLVLCGALFLDALDVSMIGVALPSIRTDLHMSTSSLQWGVSAYVLGYGGFLQFAKATRARGLIEMDWDEAADDYLVRPESSDA